MEIIIYENGMIDYNLIHLCKSVENIKDEIFIDIKDYKGLYQISNYGRIKALNWKGLGMTRIRKQQIDKNGYLRCTLSKDAKNKNFIVHQIIGKHFLKLIKHKPNINHIDGNKLNNKTLNLEWCDIRENNIHAFKNGFLSKGGRPLKKDKIKDYTQEESFWTRLLLFVSDIQCNSAIMKEEKEMIIINCNKKLN